MRLGGVLCRPRGGRLLQAEISVPVVLHQGDVLVALASMPQGFFGEPLGQDQRGSCHAVLPGGVQQEKGLSRSLGPAVSALHLKCLPLVCSKGEPCSKTTPSSASSAAPSTLAAPTLVAPSHFSTPSLEPSTRPISSSTMPARFVTVEGFGCEVGPGRLPAVV